MISYAQNFEDIMLYRALKDIRNGFYVDVGAWSPDYHSVTKAFYDAGWRGINIEPNPTMHKQCIEKRPDDINLCLAVSNQIGKSEMYFVSSSGLSSLDKTTSDGYQSSGLSVEKNIVDVSTLNQIFVSYAEEKEIHFLKIDVEGFEAQVIQGADWKRFRPWILVIEATLPNSQIENHHIWEPMLFVENYYFAYADGLNRWYVSLEHIDLLNKFKYPPNVFDNYKLA